MSDSEGEDFQDAVEELEEKDLPEEEISKPEGFDPTKVFVGSKFEGLSICDDVILAECQKGLDLFLSNQFEECKALFEDQKSTSMYHALAYGTVLSVRAVLTLEPDDIQAAFSQLKVTVGISNSYRKKDSLIGSMSKLMKSSSEKLADLTKEELHAELAYAESTLLKAVITFLAEEGLMGFVKGGFSIKNSYQTYRGCLKLIQKLEKEGTLAGSKEINNHFVSGVDLGNGIFSLVFSLMPAKLLKLFEMVGVSASREQALKLLEDGGNLQNGVRGPLCDLVTLLFHAVLGGMLELPDIDLDKATAVLTKNLKKYPNGALFLFFEGKINQARKLLRTAIECYNKAIKAELVWRQLHHICYWELCWNHALLLEWELAANFAGKLFEESKWSKSFYAYEQASFLLMTGNAAHAGKIKELMESVPKNKQKIAGKSIPIEKFVVRKTRQFFSQGYLVLPAFEVVYMWGYFRLIGESLTDALKTVEAAITEAKARNGSSLADDLGICNIIKGSLLRQEGDLVAAEEAFGSIIQSEKDLKLDHYLAPFARMELGQLFLDSKRFEEAKEQLEAAKKYKKFSMENRLHFRVHLLLSQLDGKVK